MTPHLFFVSPARLDEVEGSTQVDGEEGRHAVTVKRVRLGELVSVADGNGRLVTGPVVEIEGKSSFRVTWETVSRINRPSPRLTVIQSIIKQDRLEHALTALTECGVDGFLVFPAERSPTAMLSERAVARIERRVQEAAKQSRRAIIPSVTFAVDFPAVIEAIDAMRLAIVMDENATVSLADLAVPQNSDVALIVGPEGGFTGTEIGNLHTAGATVVRAGPTVMRADTAPVAATGWLMGASGRWKVPDSVHA